MAHLIESSPPRTPFTADLVRDGAWIVAQCREVDVASQGTTEAEAIANLREALELWFDDRPDAPSDITVSTA